MKQPADVFLDWLSSQPADARVAVAIDSDRLIGETGLLGKPSIADANGRAWQIVVFRGDDLAFRLRFRKASEHPRTVLVLMRGLPDKPIDVSCVTDILARNEAGLPLDLSVPAFFRSICPKINFPVDELRRHKEPLLNRLENVPGAAAKLVDRWGRPDDWGRGQIAALVLLSQHPELSLGDFWPDETDPAEFLVHGLRVILGSAQMGVEPEIVREMIQEAARPQVREHLFWLDVPAEELAAYLVLRLAADQLKLQNPANQLAGLHLFSLETPLPKMEGLGLRVARTIAADEKLWPKVQAKADVFVTPARLERVAQLLPTAGNTPAVRADLPPMLLFHQLRQAMLGFLKTPAPAGLAWAKPLAGLPILTEAAEGLSGRAAQCRAVLRFILAVSGIEERLGVAVPKFPHADALLDWYVQQGQHRMELDLSRAFHDIEEGGDAELAEGARFYLFGGQDDLAPAPQSLKGRVRSRLDELDRALAGFVRSSPAAFAQGANSALGMLKSRVKPAADKAILGTTDGRVWVLIFDGMRFDTWDSVVRPLVAEHFTFKGKPWFCVLPSYTAIARTSLLAGCLPDEWKNHKAASTKDEATLVAMAMGLTAQEAKTKLRFVTEADTTKARMSMGFADKDAREVNVLIYPISDECHEFRGDLATFNNRIRTDLLGDKAQGTRGILDDLLRRIRPEDTVLLTSDHGFIEMLSPDAVLVTDSEAQAAARVPQEDIRYRYTKGFRPSQTPDAVELLAGSERHFMAVGGQWFRRESSKLVPRYWHGGLSLAEVVIPGYVLSRVSEKQARVELDDVNVVGVSVPEDEAIDYAFAVRNSGNVEVKYDLSVRSNLGEDLLSHQATLAPGGVWKATCRLIGKYRQTPAREVDPAGTLSGITIRLRHTDLQDKWRDALDGLVTIPVKVHAKTTKLETDALKGFDDI
jgi:hypothetical protein